MEAPRGRVQTVIFSKREWALPMAVAWLKKGGYSGLDPDVTQTSYRFRQAEPHPHADYRTTMLPNGISIVYQKVRPS